MQDNENQGRVLFKNPSARTTPEAVANQVLSTGRAEVDQIQRGGAEKQKQINDILNGINTLAKGSIQIQEKQNAKTIQSIDSAREISALNVQNEFLNIDKLNIPIQEKFAKKQEVINNFKLNGLQTQQALQQNKGMWQKILGTEDDFNLALQGQANKQKKFEMSLDESMVAEAQKTETELTKQNIGNAIKSMQNAGTENGILNAKNVALNNINQAFQSGKISEAEVLNYRTQALQNADNRKVKVAINEAMDKALINGDFDTAVNDLSVAYNEVMQKEGYNKSRFANISDRPGSATEIRNAVFQLQKEVEKEVVTKKAEITLDNIDYTKSFIENLATVEEKTKDEPQEIKDKAKKMLDENQKKFEKNPIDFFQNPNATYKAKNEWLQSKGVGEKTAFSSNSQIANGIKFDFNRIGNLTTNNDKNSTPRQEFETIYEKYLEQMDNNQLFLSKEIKIHGEGLDYMMTQARINGDEDFLNELIATKVQKNSPQGLRNTKNNLNKTKDFISSNEKALKYEKVKDPAGYEKIKAGILDYSNYLDKSIGDTVKKLYKDKDFITDGKNDIKIDLTKYDKQEVISGIKKVKNNALQIFGNKKNIIGKYDLAENLYTYDDEIGNIYFMLKDQKGNQNFLGTMKIEDLPTSEYINPYENLPNKIETKQDTLETIQKINQTSGENAINNIKKLFGI